MARYLTVEDLNRLGGQEVVVEDGTIVTPQALEEARARGITIRTKNGRWREPAPDRGPDAERAQTSLPHLPEPSAEEGTGMVVTVVGKNRPGVLAEVTGQLAACGANIHDISQKMIEQYFHMVLTCELPPEGSFPDMKAKLECMGGEEDYVVRVMHERVFRFMHRI